MIRLCDFLSFFYKELVINSAFHHSLKNISAKAVTEYAICFVDVNRDYASPSKLVQHF